MTIDHNLQSVTEKLQGTLQAIPAQLEVIHLRELELPPRAENALARAGISDLGGLKRIGAASVADLPNIGLKTVRDLDTALSVVLQRRSPIASPKIKFDSHGFQAEDNANEPQTVDGTELWQDIMRATRSEPNAPSVDLQIIQHRYGLQGRRRQTLEEVGHSLHLTRQRIAQRQERLLRRLRHPSYRAFRFVSDRIREQVSSCGLATISDIVIGASSSGLAPKEVALLAADVSGKDLEIAGEEWVVPRKGLPAKLRAVLRGIDGELPGEVSWADAAQNVRNTLRHLDLSDSAAVGLFVVSTGRKVIRAPAGQCIGIRATHFTLADAISLVLKQAGGELSLRELEHQIRDRYSKWSSKDMRSIQNVLWNDKRFVQVNLRAYDLKERNHILLADGVRIADTAYGVLKRIGRPSDVQFLLAEIRIHIVAPRALNPYLVHSVIKLDHRFSVLHRFHIGLREWERVSERPFTDAVMETLTEANRPLTQKQVRVRLRNRYTARSYSVAQALQRLANEQRILKIRPGTYATFGALEPDANVTHVIQERTAQFLVDSGIPIVSRFYRQWLLKSGAISQEVSDAQVDCALAKARNLIRISYGLFVPGETAHPWLEDPIGAHAEALLQKANEPLQRAHLVWELSQIHYLSPLKLWKRLAKTSIIELYPFDYVGLREWGVVGWQKVICLSKHLVIADFRNSSPRLPEWLTERAAHAIELLANERGEDWLLTIVKLMTERPR